MVRAINTFVTFVPIIMRYFIFILILITGWNCKNDFDLLSPFQELPVVYGVLDISDEIHYIILQRAFQASSSIQLSAQNPDSIYYDNAKVELKNLSTGKIFSFEATTVAARDTGYFLNNPNLVYVAPSDFKLEAGKSFEVEVTENEKFLASAQTTILKSFPITNPRANEQISFNRPKVNVRWLSSEEIATFEVYWLIHLVKISGATSEDITLNWPVGGTEEITQLSFDGEDFYRTLSAQLEPSSKIMYQFVKLDLLVVGGTEEFTNYRSAIQANQGLTSAVSTPIFTNIKGGLGLFTSRITSKINAIRLTDETLDSLRNGRYTKAFNFQ